MEQNQTTGPEHINGADHIAKYLTETKGLKEVAVTLTSSHAFISAMVDGLRKPIYRAEMFGSPDCNEGVLYEHVGKAEGFLPVTLAGLKEYMLNPH